MLNRDTNSNSYKEKFIAVTAFIGLLVFVAVFKSTNAQSIAYNNKDGLLSTHEIHTALGHTNAFPEWEIDSAKVKKETNEFTFYETESGVIKEYRGTIKKGELTSLYIDDERIPKNDFSKYQARINKRVKKDNAEMEKKQQGKEWEENDKVFNGFIKDVKQLLIGSGIKNVKDDYSLILDAKKLMINYKKMPDELRDKAKKLYMKHYKEDIGDQILLRNAQI